MQFSLRKWLPVLIGCSVWTAAAADTFTVREIEVRGLNRISLGAVLLALPVRPGELMTDEVAALSMHRLYATGDFNDITLSRDGDKFIVTVSERPTIGNVEFSGNKQMDTDRLRTIIEQQGLRSGEALNTQSLAEIKQSLEDFYHGAGMYQARVEAVVEELPRNRVNVRLEFTEGVSAQIRQIHFIGNHSFPEDVLRAQLQLRDDVPWWNFMANQRYDSQKFRGDLETLRTYYLDRGFARFKIENTAVSMTPDRKALYLTVTVDEGEPYAIGEVAVRGNPLEFGPTMQDLLEVKPGDAYSQTEIARNEKILANFLGKFGYANSVVRAVPRFDDEARTVGLDFFVEPGARIYVSQVRITGNTATDDPVIRREMRQMDGTWLSNEAVDLSKDRLNRTGFFETVDFEQTPAGTAPDLVNLDVKVKEQPTGAISGGIGFGTDSGLILRASVSQSNLFGWGTRAVVAAYENDYRKHFELGYTDPYYTVDNVSLGGRIFYDSYDGDDDNVIDYTNKTWGFDLTAGYPLSETLQVDYSLGYRHSKIRNRGAYFVQGDVFWAQYQSLDRQHGTFVTYPATVSLTRSSLDRAIFPTAGSRQTVSLTAALPNSDLRYYKTRAETAFYLPFNREHTVGVSLRACGGYADGYGKKGGQDERVPFWENFYLGGSEWLRGFDHNSIGPRAVFYGSHSRTALGGNAYWAASLEFYTPTPLLPEEYKNSVRTSVFFDLGSLWDTRHGDYKFLRNGGGHRVGDRADDESGPGKYRSAVGVGLTWMSPVGPLVFSFAKAVKKQPHDDTEVFNFSIGGSF